MSATTSASRGLRPQTLNPAGGLPSSRPPDFLSYSRPPKKNENSWRRLCSQRCAYQTRSQNHWKVERDDLLKSMTPLLLPLPVPFHIKWPILWLMIKRLNDRRSYWQPKRSQIKGARVHDTDVISVTFIKYYGLRVKVVWEYVNFVLRFRNTPRVQIYRLACLRCDKVDFTV